MEAAQMRLQEAESLLGINTLVEVQNVVPSEHLAGFPGAESILPNVDLITVEQIPTPPFDVLQTLLVNAETVPSCFPTPSTQPAMDPQPPFGILQQPSMPPLPAKSAKRFIRYLTPCPQSHADCWAGNAPTTLHEKATVKMLFLPSHLTHDGFTTSHVALMCGSSAAATLVLDTVNPAGSITTSKGLTLLHAAALGGQPVAVLQQLVQRGCSPRATDAKGCSVMHCAAIGGGADTLKYILANGGSMTKDSDGYTVLMAAAEGGSVEAMTFALTNGGRIPEKQSCDCS